MGRLVVTGVTVPQYGVEGKHAVLYCRSSLMMTMLMLMGDCASERGLRARMPSYTFNGICESSFLFLQLLLGHSSLLGPVVQEWKRVLQVKSIRYQLSFQLSINTSKKGKLIFTSQQCLLIKN